MELSQNELFLIKDVFRQIKRQMKLNEHNNYIFHDIIVFDEEEKADIESISQKTVMLLLR